jgi:hypothetical protein
MSDREIRLTLTEAINRAGPVLFGSDWIENLTPAEAKLLSKYGPKPYGKPLRKIGMILLHDVEHRFLGEPTMVLGK